jgi:hypothetical protein
MDEKIGLTRVAGKARIRFRVRQVTRLLMPDRAPFAFLDSSVEF